MIEISMNISFHIIQLERASDKEIKDEGNKNVFYFT